MTKFYLNDLEKWMHQNEAEIMDCLDGCLLDNYLVETKRGYAAIYEHAVTCWSSNYYVEFEPTKKAGMVFKNWENFYEKYWEETA